MTDQPNASDPSARRNAFAWLLFPLALFPLVALLTYDWRAIPSLHTPAIHSSNWIGALGDGFASSGYALFGLAIWIVPVLCVIAALCAILGKRTRALSRLLWFSLFLVSVSCLLQAVSVNLKGIGAFTTRVNAANAGGAIGYLIMTRTLSPLLNDFGAAVLVAIVMLISLLAAIGVREFASACSALFRWALAGSREPRGAMDEAPPDSAEPPAGEKSPYDALRDQYRAAREAREAARLAARQEKERIKAEKQAAKEAARAARLGNAPIQQPKPSSAEATAPQTAAEDKGPYILPGFSLLNPPSKAAADHGDIKEMSKKLIDTLNLFGVDASIAYTVQGPVVTKYALRLAPGLRYSVVTNIADNLKGALHAKSIRIETPIPGDECIGIEVPNRAPAGISFAEIVQSPTWRDFKGELPLLFGKDAAGKELIADLAKMPHMLVAGATGQGKSVCLNAIINGLLMTKTPEQLKLIMVDPKSVEFTSYVAIPHLIVPIITDNRKVVYALRWAVKEMESRLKMFARARVRNIYDFNHRLQFTQTDMFGNDSEVGSAMPKTIPYIVIIIDEVADLMMAAAKEVTPDISRLTAKARAAGIHLILATQRPDAKIITGTIKANIPGRVAFKTSTAIDSRTILDDSGAENLIGKGDMLFRTADGLLIRAQGAWISDPEIARITQFIEQHANTQFDENFANKLSRVKEASVDDPFADNADDPDNQQPDESAQGLREQAKSEAADDDFKKAVECIITTKRASTSHFQRQMGWGYNHAARILDRLAERGVVSAPQGMGPRQIIMDQPQLEAILNETNEATGNDEPGESIEQSTPTDDTPIQENEQ